MQVTRRAEARRSQTPNAVMTTLASPTQGGAACAVWRVDMAAGQAGPVHRFDVEQVYTVLAGAATVELAGSSTRLAAGDTAVLPAGVLRQVTADAHTGVVAIMTAAPGGRAALADGTDRGVPEWVA